MKFGDKLLNEILTFDENGIYDSSRGEVMGIHEIPLMEKYAIEVNHNGGNILEIGFGMGLFATKSYSLGVESYTIVEFHPQVIEKLYEWSKDKPEIIIIEGNWFDKLDEIKDKKYDGIFFDTHMDDERLKFRELIVENCIKDDGVFGYFNIDEEPDTFNYGDDLQNESIFLPPIAKLNIAGGNMIASWVKYPLS